MLAGTQKPMLGTKLNRARPLAKGLVGCWLFNEGGGNKAYDSSGYHNHGTLEGMAFPPIATSGWNPGKNGVRLVLDGDNDYIDCGNDSSLNITDAITIEAWAKPASVNEKQRIVIGRGNYNLMIDTNAEVGFNDSHGHGIKTDDNAIEENNWYHFVGVFRGQQGDTISFFNCKIFLNGISSGTILQSGDWLPEEFDGVLIGRIVNTQYFNGSICEVKIYNRALSAEEIKWSYRAPYAMFEDSDIML